MNKYKIEWAKDPIVRAVQTAITEAGFAAQIFACGNGLHIRGLLGIPLSDKDHMWLMFENGTVVIKARLILTETHDLANPNSIDAIIRTIRKYRQKWKTRSDACNRVLPG